MTEKFLRSKRPAFVVLENLTALMKEASAGEKSDADFIIETLADMGYHARASFQAFDRPICRPTSLQSRLGPGTSASLHVHVCFHVSPARV